MKYLLTIWAMILFLLACVPCTDSGMVFAQNVDALEQVDLDHTDAEQEDLCSPLCECNCCGGITLAFQLQKVTAPHVLPQSAYKTNYIIQGPVSPVLPFWHPPKV